MGRVVGQHLIAQGRDSRHALRAHPVEQIRHRCGRAPEMLVEAGHDHPIGCTAALLPHLVLELGVREDERTRLIALEAPPLDAGVGIQELDAAVRGSVVVDDEPVHPVVVGEEVAQHVRLVPADGVQVHLHRAADGSSNAARSWRTTRAGLPSAIERSGRSRVTTAPAPTTAWAPTLTSESTTAPAPIRAPAPTVTPPASTAPGPTEANSPSRAWWPMLAPRLTSVNAPKAEAPPRVT